MKNKKKYLFQRIIARATDYTFILIIVKILAISNLGDFSTLSFYLLYNILIALIGAPSLGKWLWGFKIKLTDTKKHMSYFIREFIFIVLFPIVAIHFLFCFNRGIHEKVSQTDLIKDYKS